MPVPFHVSALAIFLLALPGAFAEDGAAAWLRYAPVPAARYANLPSSIVVLGNSSVERTAGEELARGLSAMLGRPFHSTAQASGIRIPHRSAIVLGTYASVKPFHSFDHPLLDNDLDRDQDQYTIDRSLSRGITYIWVAGNAPQAELYGVFHLLEEVGTTQEIPMHEAQSASATIRWTDEWDNLDGTIERGYAGPSFFFKGGHIRQDLHRASDYARLLSSVGINGCNVNNVNADLDLLSTDHLQEFARLAEAFRPWGVKLALSVDLTSPQTVGGLATFDPVDPTVIAWWQQKVDEIYRLIPDLAGFTVKADSEGRLGPSKYHRSRQTPQTYSLAPSLRIVASCSTGASSITIISIGAIQRQIVHEQESIILFVTTANSNPMSWSRSRKAPSIFRRVSQSVRSLQRCSIQT